MSHLIFDFELAMETGPTRSAEFSYVLYMISNQVVNKKSAFEGSNHPCACEFLGKEGACLPIHTPSLISLMDDSAPLPCYCLRLQASPHF
ncbi:hypothetical protein Y032_0220g2502 [Ancylostoma ceylanicum]|uniref:Uncharacterized protein n=1 Tax=Ancylostoma ceylanicum TaxID=53326 RepID=A0A016SJB9_9BILA|nr:hypothetical protein Y032_0220g2502 [Ancylostoma ceylanicum]